LGEHVRALLSFVQKNANRVIRSRESAQEREAQLG